jgi:hypothetical protein
MSTTPADLFTREQFADELEAPESLLCECDPDSPATRPSNRSVRMAHHCDCPAVAASAMIRRGESLTLHGTECGCLVLDNSMREDLGLPRLPSPW